METLNPSAYFLRVSDKFFGEFICHDKAVSAGPALLYLILFKMAYREGICRSSQAALARLCKCSVRSIQHYLRALAALKYISIEQREDGRNVYRLLLSQRVLSFIARERALDDDGDGYDKGEEFSPDHAKNLRMGGENSSPIYKKEKSNITPLSPHTPANRESAPSTRAPSQNTMPVPAPQAGGWGDTSSGEKRKGNVPAFQAVNAVFERFYAAYPRKEAKEMARSAWHQLWRRGALPALDELTASLERFRASAQWLKDHGRYVPFLVNWLRGQRWADAPEFSTGVQPAPQGAQGSARRICAFTPPKLMETPEEIVLRKDHCQAVSELQKLWPAASRNNIQSVLLLARVRGLGLKDVINRAREYVQETSTARLSLGDWLKQEVFA